MMYSWCLELKRWQIPYDYSFYINKVLKEEVEHLAGPSYNQLCEGYVSPTEITEYRGPDKMFENAQREN